jgi:hypothetical protein
MSERIRAKSFGEFLRREAIQKNIQLKTMGMGTNLNLEQVRKTFSDGNYALHRLPASEIFSIFTILDLDLDQVTSALKKFRSGKRFDFIR